MNNIAHCNYREWKRLSEYTYEEKLMSSRTLIASVLKQHKRPCVSLSWGKDSVIMLYLIREFCKKTAVIFANTQCEYPETYKYRDMMLKNHLTDLNYFETRPIKNFWQCVEEYGFPHMRQSETTGTKRTPKCCQYLKEKPLMKKQKELEIDLEFWGLQTSESMNRRRLFMRLGSYYFNQTRKRYVCLPMALWNDSDVKRYAKEHNIPLNPLYKTMKRTGCMFCTGFKDWKAVMNKYNSKLYKHILNQKDGQQVLDCF